MNINKWSTATATTCRAHAAFLLLPKRAWEILCDVQWKWKLVQAAISRWRRAQMHFRYAAAATAGCHRFPTGATAQQQHHHQHHLRHHQCCCCCWLDTQSIVLFYFVLCLLVSCFCCVFFFYAYYKSVSLSLSLSLCCRAASSHFGQIFRYLWLFSSVQFKFASRAVWVLCRRVDRVVIRSCKG